MRFWICSLLFVAACASMEALQVNGLSYEKSLKPGETAQLRISLISDKDKPEHVDLKQCNYTCNSEGQHFFEDASDESRSNLKWISLSTQREVVNPGETKDVFVTINVPKDDSLKGSYWSVLLIEPTDPVQTLAGNDNGFQLNVKVRYAYHIVTNIGNGTPSLKIIKKGVETIDGKKYFAVDVSNNGTQFLNPKMTVKLLNSQGKLEKTIETQNERLYPGSSTRFISETGELSPGKYTAFLLLDNGDGRLFGDTYELSFQ